MSSAVVVVSNFSELQVEDFAFEDTVVFIERVLQHKVRVQHVDVAEHLWGRGGGGRGIKSEWSTYMSRSTCSRCFESGALSTKNLRPVSVSKDRSTNLSA